MSLYTYVPGRSELIELMIDRVYADHPLPDPALGWRARTEEWMRATWATYAAHPWLLDYNMARLPVGPHVLDVDEALYAALDAAGFTGAENVALANLVRWQLLGAARRRSAMRPRSGTPASPRRRTGSPGPASG